MKATSVRPDDALGEKPTFPVGPARGGLNPPPRASSLQLEAGFFLAKDVAWKQYNRGSISRRGSGNSNRKRARDPR